MNNIAAAGLFAAVDVRYADGFGARGALVATADRAFSTIVAERSALVCQVAPYRPGEFYMRELPPLRAVLGELDQPSQLALIVIDGYVDLDPQGRPGLGAYVHEEFGVPVVGVAKSAFLTATHAIAVRRGHSGRPLFVTAAGISRDDAASLVADMAGQFRLPDALRRVDALARLAGG